MNHYAKGGYIKGFMKEEAKKEEDFGLYTLVPETGTIFGHLQKD